MQLADRVRGTRLAVAAAVAILASASMPVAQRATVPELKAAYLLNFAKFTEWPVTVLPAGMPIVVCTLNDPEVAATLKGLIRAVVIDGHGLVTSPLKAEGGVPAGCHMIFASALDASQWRLLLDSVGDRPMLTVGDMHPGIGAGVIVGFFVEKDKLRFAINPDAAQGVGLKLSSKLLRLAVIVNDGLPGPASDTRPIHRRRE